MQNSKNATPRHQSLLRAFLSKLAKFRKMLPALVLQPNWDR